jgi:hypothetical protein
MLGIQPGNVAPPSPQPSSSSSSGGGQRETPPGSPRNQPAGSGSARALSDSGVETESSTKHDSPHDKLRKHHRWVRHSALVDRVELCSADITNNQARKSRSCGRNFSAPASNTEWPGFRSRPLVRPSSTEILCSRIQSHQVRLNIMSSSRTAPSTPFSIHNLLIDTCVYTKYCCNRNHRRMK